ncbi:MAG: flagellar motor protein MotB, partial [Candidatus Thiodiazotropha sp. 6PLUC10]
MGRRRKRQEEPVNHERWIVSYADFVTLLFAFFVVMYSVSSVNEGKYRVLSQTLTHAFQESQRSLEPIQVGELARSRGDTPGLGQESALIEGELR